MNTVIMFPLISYSSELVDGQPIFVSSNSLPIKASNFEPAGHSFHAAALKLLGLSEDEDADSDNQSVCSDDRNQGYTQFSESYKTKGKKKSGEGKQQDHYALLGLGHLRFLATEEQIRKSYRETALKHHPDKLASLILAEETEEARQAKKDEIENHFKLIQESYEILVDPVKRRIYDSTDECDDEIPTDCAPSDFFKVFGPAFMRNARWSVSQPVPNLGDENTPINTVDSFYNFWFNFKSWREFPHEDEFDLEQAESRDHKRWMERQNIKIRESARKEEYARIRTLVDIAYKKDPRILRRKEEEKAEKQRKKEARALAKKLQEEEAKRIAEEEKRKREEEERRAAEASLNLKRQKEKEKKLIRKERARLRMLSAEVITSKLLGLSENDVEGICSSLDMEALQQLCDNMEGKQASEKAQLVKDMLNRSSLDTKQVNDNMQGNGSHLSASEINGIEARPKEGVPSSVYQKKEKPWAKEEIEMLRKGMLKYPKGTSRRWQVISEYIGTSRSVEEILKATKTVLLQKPDSSKAFDSFLEKRKPAATISSPLSTRLESEGASTEKPDVAAPILAQQCTTGNSSQLMPTSTAPTSAAPTSSGFSSVSEQDSWSVAQERALIQALKAFPKDASQRWERVAAAVPGKTVNQCKKKFLLMKENFKSKKSGE